MKVNLNIMTFNIKHGADSQFDLRKIAQRICECNAEIVALQVNTCN
jgi:endonuclease/exonuclease/phosphatase family metal-dependent hydrolase